MKGPLARLSLARLPTPLERAAVLAKETGLDLWVKRDDLTGVAVSGNKVRKLEFLAAEALARNADTLVTCGAVNSNHARATAAVAARLGLRSHLLLRGTPGERPEGNLLLDRFLGADTTFIPKEAWPERDERMAAIAARLAEEGRRAYVIPEGGSNALGCLGYAQAVDEILRQEREAGIEIRRIVHATGSGGTTAGLAHGLASRGREDVDVLGVAVCDDRAYFDRKVAGILDDCVRAGTLAGDARRRARWTILEGWKGEGYGRTTPHELAEIAGVARRTGICLDPVYTGKAFRALVGVAGNGSLERDGATVFLHTGGLFGLFAYAREIAALDPTR